MVTKTKILIISAMHEEVAPLINYLSCKYSKFKVNDKCIIFVNDDKVIHIRIIGVGMPNVVNSMLDLNFESYTSVINLGTVGARGNYKIGDIVGITSVYNGDFDLTNFNYEPYEIPGLGSGIPISCLVYDDIKSSKCISVSKFMESSESIKQFSEYVVDMELYMIALILRKLNYSNFYSYKVVTDVTDNNAKEEHETTLEQCSERLCKFVYYTYFDH